MLGYLVYIILVVLFSVICTIDYHDEQWDISDQDTPDTQFEEIGPEH